MVGYTRSYGAGYNDILLLKYDQQGNLIWNKTWGGSDFERGHGVAVDNSGYIYVTGFTCSYGAGYEDAVLLKYTPDGTLIWSETWGGTDDDRGNGVAIDYFGYIYVTGTTYSYGAGNSDVFLLKYYPNGSLVDSRTWGGSGSDESHGIAVGSGCIYVTGGTFSYGAGGSDVFLLKYDISGNLIQNKTWGGSGSDTGYGIVFNPYSGYIYVTGTSGSDVFLLKAVDLVERYKPLFIFHHEEEYLPVVFDAMIDQGFVINPNDNTTVDYGDKKVKYAKIVEANPSPDRLDDPDINKESYQLTFDPDIKSNRNSAS